MEKSMDYILNGFVEAFRLIFSFDPEIIQIVLLSLFVSFFIDPLRNLDWGAPWHHSGNQ